MNGSLWKSTSRAGRGTAVFLGGGILYSLLEISLRGYSHWTMTLTGGLCALLMYLRYTSHPDDTMLAKCFFGMCIITFFEFTVGCIVNLLLGWDVWDYSHMYLNLWGQICPSYSAGWFLLSCPVALLCDLENDGRKNAGGNISENYSV